MGVREIATSGQRMGARWKFARGGPCNFSRGDRHPESAARHSLSRRHTRVAGKAAWRGGCSGGARVRTRLVDGHGTVGIVRGGLVLAARGQAAGFDLWCRRRCRAIDATESPGGRALVSAPGGRTCAHGRAARNSKLDLTSIGIAMQRSAASARKHQRWPISSTETASTETDVGGPNFFT